MQKWEYLRAERSRTSNYSKAEVESINGVYVQAKEQKLFHSYIQELGKEGWELVSVQEGAFYFKRPIE